MLRTGSASKDDGTTVNEAINAFDKVPFTITVIDKTCKHVAYKERSAYSSKDDAIRQARALANKYRGVAIVTEAIGVAVPHSESDYVDFYMFPLLEGELHDIEDLLNK